MIAFLIEGITRPMEDFVLMLIAVGIANGHPGKGIWNDTDLVKIPSGLSSHSPAFNFNCVQSGKKRNNP
jgi:hypothetical protein